MVVEGQICLQTSDVDNGSHADAVCGPLSICQAYAIQQRVLCGHWGTNGPYGNELFGTGRLQGASRLWVYEP